MPWKRFFFIARDIAFMPEIVYVVRIYISIKKYPAGMYD